jgi:putative ABC transport system permease protein
MLRPPLVRIPGDGGMASRVMSGGQRAGGNSPARQRVQRGLVVVQVAVTVMLLAGAGLLTQTIIRLTRVDTGLRADPLTMSVTLLTGAEARDTDAVRAMRQKFEQIRTDLAALPGVTAVGIGG